MVPLCGSQTAAGANETGLLSLTIVGARNPVLAEQHGALPLPVRNKTMHRQLLPPQALGGEPLGRSGAILSEERGPSIATSILREAEFERGFIVDHPWNAKRRC